MEDLPLEERLNRSFNDQEKKEENQLHDSTLIATNISQLVQPKNFLQKKRRMSCFTDN